MGSCRGEGMIEMHNIYIPSRGYVFQKMTAGIKIKGEEKKGKRERGRKKGGKKRGRGKKKGVKGRGGKRKGGGNKGWGKCKRRKWIKGMN